jgi:uncharacterized protein YdaT
MIATQTIENRKGENEMKKAEEKEIITEAVAQAHCDSDPESVTRSELARAAALIADKNGVNVQVAPYLQDIFYSALDEYII